MRLGIATALLSLCLTGCKNTIAGSWKPYSYNKFELPMSICEKHPKKFVQVALWPFLPKRCMG